MRATTIGNTGAIARTCRNRSTPYVHTDGARVPALRRLYKKWPYFTSGRAKSLAELLDRFASSPTATYHDAAPDAQLTRLTADEKSALLAFLDLL